MWALRQSTASQEIPLGPFVDSTDGDSPETALVIANTDVKLFKAGATSETSKNNGGATHMAAGRYYAELDATDTNTPGPMRVSVHVAGALAVWLDCLVYPASVYDALLAGTGDGIRADLRTWIGSAPLGLSGQRVPAVVPATTVVESVTNGVAIETVSGTALVAATAAATATAITNAHGPGSYERNTEPDNAGIAATRARTDLIPDVPARVGSAMTLADAAITEAAIAMPAETAGRPAGLLGMMRRVFEWSANKRTRDQGTGLVSLRNAADNATLESQTQSTAAGVDTITKGA